MLRLPSTGVAGRSISRDRRGVNPFLTNLIDDTNQKKSNFEMLQINPRFFFMRLQLIQLRRQRFVRVCLFFMALATTGCMSLTTNTTLLSDSSHLGTPYSGVRADLHILVCFSRSVSRDASSLLFTPVMLVPLIDLPFSFALDTLLLPFDIPLKPERPPQRIGQGGCRLIGM